MSRDKQRSGPPTSKPQSQSGISVSPQEVYARLEALEKFIKDNFDERNNWNSQVREWVGKRVYIRVMHNVGSVTGKLKWLDRYTLCIEEDDGDITIVHKGSIATISLDD